MSDESSFELSLIRPRRAHPPNGQTPQLAIGLALPLICTSWYDAMPDGFIALSEKGWTDNELGLIWFENCFEKAIATYP